MKADTIKLLFTYLIAIGIIAGTYYALVLSPFLVESDVKLWLTGAAGGALAFVFGDQVAARSRVDQQSAFHAGLGATPNAPAGPGDVASLESMREAAGVPPPPTPESKG